MKRVYLKAPLILTAAILFAGCQDTGTDTSAPEPSVAGEEIAEPERPATAEESGEVRPSANARFEQPTSSANSETDTRLPDGENTTRRADEHDEPADRKPDEESESTSESAGAETETQDTEPVKAESSVVDEEVNWFPEALLPTRPRKRLNITQLDSAIEAVTGGLRWKESPGDTTSLYEQLAVSLGEPDYLTLTTEDLTPGVLFQKFLGDASRKICAELVSVDPTRPASDRALYLEANPEHSWATHPDEITANLVALLERFHSHSLSENSPQLENWKWLYQSAELIGENSERAWEVVCIGLLQHPDFYSY